jgi:hypothetical protein
MKMGNLLNAQYLGEQEIVFIVHVVGNGLPEEALLNHVKCGIPRIRINLAARP